MADERGPDNYHCRKIAQTGEPDALRKTFRLSTSGLSPRNPEKDFWGDPEEAYLELARYGKNLTEDMARDWLTDFPELRPHLIGNPALPESVVKQLGRKAYQTLTQWGEGPYREPDEDQQARDRQETVWSMDALIELRRRQGLPPTIRKQVLTWATARPPESSPKSRGEASPQFLRWRWAWKEAVERWHDLRVEELFTLLENLAQQHRSEYPPPDMHLEQLLCLQKATPAFWKEAIRQLDINQEKLRKMTHNQERFWQDPELRTYGLKHGDTSIIWSFLGWSGLRMDGKGFREGWQRLWEKDPGRAMQALDTMGDTAARQLRAEDLQQALRHSDAHIREQALRFIGRADFQQTDPPTR